jgi:hypothetical protein
MPVSGARTVVGANTRSASSGGLSSVDPFLNQSFEELDNIQAIGGHDLHPVIVSVLSGVQWNDSADIVSIEAMDEAERILEMPGEGTCPAEEATETVIMDDAASDAGEDEEVNGQGDLQSSLRESIHRSESHYSVSEISGAVPFARDEVVTMGRVSEDSDDEEQRILVVSEQPVLEFVSGGAEEQQSESGSNDSIVPMELVAVDGMSSPVQEARSIADNSAMRSDNEVLVAGGSLTADVSVIAVVESVSDLICEAKASELIASPIREAAVVSDSEDSESATDLEDELEEDNSRLVIRVEVLGNSVLQDLVDLKAEKIKQLPRMLELEPSRAPYAINGRTVPVCYSRVLYDFELVVLGVLYILVSFTARQSTYAKIPGRSQRGAPSGPRVAVWSKRDALQQSKPIWFKLRNQRVTCLTSEKDVLCYAGKAGDEGLWPKGTNSSAKKFYVDKFVYIRQDVLGDYYSGVVM